MIRYFTDLCKSVFDKYIDVEIFNNYTNEFEYSSKRCPNCGAMKKLDSYGDYDRGLVSHDAGKVVSRRIKPLRFKCTSCQKTHALLPDILIAKSPYSLRFKILVLVAYFKREMTVEKIAKYFGIAISTIYEWKKRLLAHKELILGVLLNTKTPVAPFLCGLLTSGYLSKTLCDFCEKYGVSFLERPPKTTTWIYQT